MNARATTPLDAQAVRWLLAAIVITLAPHVRYLPLWVPALAALALLWRVALLHSRRALPSRWVLLPVVLGVVVAVVASFKSPVGKDPGVAMLSAFLALKPLESRSNRDGYVIVFLSLFLQLAQFFEDQGMAVAALALAGTLLSVIALTALNSARMPTRERARAAGLMLAQAVPFMLVLFVLFPRLDSPLWRMPMAGESARSGLSDTMTPGSIAELSLSGATAFRVRFEGAPPPPPQRYWRGPVLTHFDGRTWRATDPRLRKLPAYQPEGPAVRYEITLEAHNRPWIYALELPADAPPNTDFALDYLLVARSAVRERMRYALTSHPAMHAGANETQALLREALVLPSGYNPRTLALAQKIAAEHPEPQARVDAAIRHYLQGDYTYTLQPPLLGRDSVDEFLFDTRRGFCEHFASSFVFLMRAAGVPARVVTGYQGGETNPVDDFLLVRQSDAHAWAEVWLAGTGWVRVDPTATVAPSRIERGIADSIAAGDPLPFALRPQFDWLRELRFRFDAVGNAWDQWVLGYNTERQKALLARLGMHSPDWSSMTSAMAAICGALMLALGAWAISQRRKLDPLARAWEALSRRLARAGLARAPWEGPRAYAGRVSAARPELAAGVAAICEDYAALRYGAPISPDQTRARMKRLRQHIQQLRI